ncbi:MAG: 50S ribosomal protein L29 [Patescibacteria group bacterium]
MSEYKNKTEKEIDKLLNEKREALRNFRFAISGSKTRNLREGRNTRREVARLMTELSDRRRL